MKRLFTMCALAGSLWTVSAFADDLTGIITCGKCKKTSAAAADCAKQCIKSGVAAIFVTSDGKTYKIANPDKIGDKINEKVTVSGSVADETLTIDSVKGSET